LKSSKRGMHLLNSIKIYSHNYVTIRRRVNWQVKYKRRWPGATMISFFLERTRRKVSSFWGSMSRTQLRAWADRLCSRPAYCTVVELSIVVRTGIPAHQQFWLIDWVRLNVPPNTLSVILGTGFYGLNDPTNSVKALKEDRSKGLGFNPIRSTPPCSQWYNNYAVWNTNTKKSSHSEMYQWDKIQSREL